MNLFFDSKLSDAERREEIYEGSIFVYSSVSERFEVVRICAGANRSRRLSPTILCKVQDQLPVERSVEILAELKPKFIHHRKVQRIHPRNAYGARMRP